ncbi:MAG TPA: hypothetical protein VF471_07110 [Pseudoxanthomonas sp.]
MSADGWSDLVPEWKSQPRSDETVLMRSVMRKQRWRKLGLMHELLGTIAVLAMTGYALLTRPPIEGMRSWYWGSALVLVVWQAGYLLMRHRYRLFGAPGGGLVGLIDAEIRHARYVIANMWFGVSGGLLLAAWALFVIPPELVPVVRTALLAATVWCIPYAIIRSYRAWRWIVRLRSHQEQLMR